MSGSVSAAPAFSRIATPARRHAVGLAAFAFFVIPWMAVAAWLFLRPGGFRQGVPSAPWRPLADYPPPARDQQHAAETQSLESGAAHDGKHAPIEIA